jgi:hypothetical protein
VNSHVYKIIYLEKWNRFPNQYLELKMYYWITLLEHSHSISEYNDSGRSRDDNILYPKLTSASKYEYASKDDN